MDDDAQKYEDRIAELQDALDEMHLKVPEMATAHYTQRIADLEAALADKQSSSTSVSRASSSMPPLPTRSSLGAKQHRLSMSGTALARASSSGGESGDPQVSCCWKWMAAESTLLASFSDALH